MSAPDFVRIEASVGAWEEIESYAAGRVKDKREALEAARLAESNAGEVGRAAQIETRLEAGPWKEATSKKCDYWRDAPSDLVQAVRSTKGGIKGQSHHFTASTTEPTLFRFKRGAKT